MKPKLQGGHSMATFSVVSHLITVLDSWFNHVTRPVHMQQTNDSSNWQDRLLASQIVHARTNTILKVMKAIGIPCHDCPPNYFWDELCGSVAIFTNPHNFSYLERSTRSCVDEPKCHSQFVTMVTHLFLFFHIMQNKFWTRHIPASWMCPDNLSSSAWISIMWGWSWSSTTNVCTLLFTSIEVWPACCFTSSYFLCCSTFSQRCLLPPPA